MGATFRDLTAALKRARFLQNPKTREWEAVRGRSIIRLAVHMERDMVGMFVDIPNPEDPDGPLLTATKGRILTFGQAMDVANGQPSEAASGGG